MTTLLTRCSRAVATVGAIAALATLALPTNGQPSSKMRGIFGEFYTRHLDCDGVPVRSAAVVEPRALTVACNKMRSMLTNAPNVQANMREWGTELHIIGRHQVTSDLPEYRWARGKVWDATGKDIDQRTRGLGGLYSSCGEENLLKLKPDRYEGSDICVHEFGHAVMDYGLDTPLQQAILTQYRAAMNSKLWKGVYAETNAAEYWAELSMWYFGGHGNRNDDNPEDGPAALKAYDPGGYYLLDAIYSGRLWPAPAKMQGVRKIAPLDKVRSLAGTTPAKLVLLNPTEQAYRLRWINYLGQPILFGILEPMSLQVRETYVTHAWSIENTVSKMLQAFTIDAALSRKVVDE